MTDLTLLPFQRRFLAAITNPAIDRAVLSCPRGGGKSTFMAWLARRFLTPGDPLHVPGGKSYIVAASLDQCRRTTFGILEGMLAGDDDYSVNSSTQQANAVHKPSRTAVRVMPANHKTAQGLVGVSYLFSDEPGAWEINGGQAMADAIDTALGKVGDAMTVIYVGTLGPNATHPGHWYYDLVKSGHNPAAGVHVQSMQGRSDRWSTHAEIRRVNPLMWTAAKSRRTILNERKAALANPRLKAQFLTYRLNLPFGDETSVLLTEDEWQTVLDRIPGPQDERPVIGIDMGAGRAWCAAVAWWPSQRIEAFALCPGIPDIAEQERRDQVPAGAYQRLVDAGLLRIAEGYNIPPAFLMVNGIRDRWGAHLSSISDRFRAKELLDAGMTSHEDRVTQWSEASYDIRALRRAVNDGNLSVGPSRHLIAESMFATMIEHDKAGNMRILKKGTANQGRDDVSAALTLAAGEACRTWGDWNAPLPDINIFSLG